MAQAGKHLPASAAVPGHSCCFPSAVPLGAVTVYAPRRTCHLLLRALRKQCRVPCTKRQCWHSSGACSSGLFNCYIQQAGSSSRTFCINRQTANTKHSHEECLNNAAMAACGTQPSIAKAGSIPQASRVTPKDQPPTGTASRRCRQTAQFPSQCQLANYPPLHKSNSDR
jgi:hypothetical protein